MSRVIIDLEQSGLGADFWRAVAPIRHLHGEDVCASPNNQFAVAGPARFRSTIPGHQYGPAFRIGPDSDVGAAAGFVRLQASHRTLWRHLHVKTPPALAGVPKEFVNAADSALRRLRMVI